MARAHWLRASRPVHENQSISTKLIHGYGEEQAWRLIPPTRIVDSLSLAADADPYGRTDHNWNHHRQFYAVVLLLVPLRLPLTSGSVPSHPKRPCCPTATGSPISVGRMF